MGYVQPAAQVGEERIVRDKAARSGFVVRVKTETGWKHVRTIKEDEIADLTPKQLEQWEQTISYTPCGFELMFGKDEY